MLMSSILIFFRANICSGIISLQYIAIYCNILQSLYLAYRQAFWQIVDSYCILFSILYDIYSLIIISGLAFFRLFIRHTFWRSITSADIRFYAALDLKQTMESSPCGIRSGGAVATCLRSLRSCFGIDIRILVLSLSLCIFRSPVMALTKSRHPTWQALKHSAIFWFSGFSMIFWY